MIFGLIGFILQFQSLRGMNWSASIAQLVCILLMKTRRAWVWCGLIAIPISKGMLEDHEMAWLVLKIAKPGRKSRNGDFWPPEGRTIKPMDNVTKVSTSVGKFARATRISPMVDSGTLSIPVVWNRSRNRNRNRSWNHSQKSEL